MSRDVTKSVDDFCKKMRRLVVRIKKTRDELRDLLSEYRDVLLPVEVAEFESAINGLSQYI